MKDPLLFGALLSLAGPWPRSPAARAAGPDKVTRNFQADAVGAPPPGFEFARTGGGAEGQWVVRIEKGVDKNHVLVQESADPTDYRFPYITRCNADEDNCTIYHTVDGRRRPFLNRGVKVATNAIEFDDLTVEGR